MRNSSLKQQFTESEGLVSVSLPTPELQPALTFELITLGRGQALVVADVEPGSSAEQAGIRRGQRLTAISDALQADKVWPIGDRPSLRFVRDTFRMRRSGNINLQLQECLTEQQIASMLPPSRFAADGNSSSEGGSSNGSSSSSGAASSADPPPPAISASSDSGTETSGDSWGMLGDQTDDGSSDSKAETIGERFARREAEAERAARLPDAMQQRMQKRKDYLEQVGQRSNTGVFGLAAVAFLGPAAVILAIAYFSGYLDKLYGQY